MFTKEFRVFWISNSYFEETIVWNFPQSVIEKFDNCTFIWINWDKLANDNYSKYYRFKPKSCDAIKLLESGIDFIEFKILKIEEVRHINTKIPDYQLIKKLKWSYELLKKINNDVKFTLLDKEDLIEKINKRFILSFYFKTNDARDKLATSLKMQRVRNSLQWYFRQNPVPFWENFNEPKLVNTEDINSLYVVNNSI